MSAPIFISHASADRNISQELCKFLEERGFPCWVAWRDVGGGENFGESIFNAISGAKVLLLVLSAHATASDEVKKELVLASQKRLTIIPLRLGSPSLSGAFSYELATRQWIDLEDTDWAKGFERLASQLTRSGVTTGSWDTPDKARAAGGQRYTVKPRLKRRRLREVGTSLWLSCYGLRQHMEAVRDALRGANPMADETRDALLKIPQNDFGGRSDWFVNAGYLSMITAYKIAAFSSWMNIYTQAILTVNQKNDFAFKFFAKFDAFKISASQKTVLWYNYIDAIGERLVTTAGEFTGPLSFSEFCKRYHDDPEFLGFFDQLHMFIHFMGRKDEPWFSVYQKVLDNMIESLRDIEKLLDAPESGLPAPPALVPVPRQTPSTPTWPATTPAAEDQC